ncbi:MAG TPA: alpha/beta hydrolase [Opitutaceae bacterium]|nr:alpha/beta hydrolase [Opitutaceae bacterium]
MRPRVVSVLRWLLLTIAIVLLVAGLFTAFPAPAGLNWEYRVLIAGVVGEKGYRFLVLPILLAIAGLALPDRSSRVSIATFGCAVAALTLGCKPMLQAWALGQVLPERLASSFGPGDAQRAPFSFRTLYAPLPPPVPSFDGTYRAGRGLEFLRAVGRSPAPCVISLHGGGWFGKGFHDRRPFNQWLARHGYAVAAIAYSVLPDARWPEPRDDVMAAITMLRAHATELGIDPSQIILLGRSAGAQLALATAFAAHDPGIKGVIAFYPPTDLRALWQSAPANDRINGYTARQILELMFGGTPDKAPASYDSGSALVLADRQSPPTLLIHGALDSLVPLAQSDELAAKLTLLHRPNELVVIPWASHGFDTVNFDGPGGQISTYAVAQFLSAVTRQRP